MNEVQFINERLGYERLGILRAEIVVLRPVDETKVLGGAKTAIIIHKIEEKRSFST